MTTFWAIMGTVALLAVAGALVMLGQLSQRLGEVMGMSAHYRWYYVSAASVGLSMLARLLIISVQTAPQAPVFLSTPSFRLLGYHIPLAAGVTVGLFVTLYYWKWLLALGPSDGTRARNQYN
jgi:hypothetical protein